jgi:hypothetical protein
LFQCKQYSNTGIELALSFAIGEIFLSPLLSCWIAPAIILCDCPNLNGGKEAHANDEGDPTEDFENTYSKR